MSVSKATAGPRRLHVERGIYYRETPKGRVYEITYPDSTGRQRWQVVRGGLREARLRGPQIGFAYVDDKGMRREFTGTVNGRQMQGTFRDDKGQSGNWSAAKK